MPVSFPVPEPRVMPRFGLLSTRQEAFCRHFVACGNAAEAARRAGYAERSARQSGHALLERSHIVERVRQIRLLWRQTARAEVQILLARLEQVWQAAAAAEAPHLMLRVVRFQAELSGLSRDGQAHRPDYWPVPDEDEFGEVAAAAGMTTPGPLAQAVQLGRDRAERALARHETRHEAQHEARHETGAPAGRDANGAVNGAGHRPVNSPVNGADAVEAARLRAEIEECRALLEPPAPAPDSDRDIAPAGTDRPFRPKPGFGEEPDIRREDQEYIDDVERDWMNSLRSGYEPTEPWADVPTHEDPFPSAQDDPEHDGPVQDDPMQDDPMQDDPVQEDPTLEVGATDDNATDDKTTDNEATGGLVAPAERVPSRHPANGFEPANGHDRADDLPCAAAPPPPAVRHVNGSAAGPNGAAHDIS